MRIDINSLLVGLEARRPVFHSEADFQHALAWELHRRDPEAEIRLEYPVPWDGERGHIDIWIHNPDGAVAIELKYWSRRLLTTVGGERFELKDQGAQPHGRYDFLKDLQRVERAVQSQLAVQGFVLAITNRADYWREGRSGQIDAAFRLHEGRRISGTMAWSPTAGTGTTRGRESEITLLGEYEAHWARFSYRGVSANDEFRYLLLQVPQSG